MNYSLRLSPDRFFIVIVQLLLLGVCSLSNTHATDCIPSPDGLVGWWRGEGDPTDSAGTNNGVLQGNTFYGTGEVGSGFVLDGNGSGISLGNPTSLQLQTFTIEAWIQRASDSAVSTGANPDDAALVAYSGGGFGLGLLNNGNLYLTRVGVDSVTVATTITDTSWHHVAVTRTGASVVFYVDGVAYPAPPYNRTFTFNSSLVIGASGTLTFGFWGSIDEMAFYNRVLPQIEIEAIYNSGMSGKCSAPAPPGIIVQPTSLTIFATEDASFETMALGIKPFAYQWYADGVSIPGATNSNVTITNAQLSSAGNYVVIVTNVYGATTSSIAALTVNAPPSCVPPPSGVVSWWPATGVATDVADGNSGVLTGNARFGPGKVSQGFVFDGNAGGVIVGNPTNLQLQDFTIEAWIRRASDTAVSAQNPNEAALIAYAAGGYGLGLFNDGSLYLTKVGVDKVTVSAPVTGTNWHHVAVTKAGATVVFYVDGVAYPAPAYNPLFTFGTSLVVGASGTLTFAFLGSMDETTIYNRALSGVEIQSIYEAIVSGKCPLSVPPVIVTQPLSTNIIAGSNVTISVLAGGSLPFSFQWYLNGTGIAGATNSSFAMTNVQFSQVGNYSVQVTNAAGSATSSNASLTVIFPPAVIRALNANAMAGAPVVIPITMTANGNENALGFSLTFNTQRLAFAGAMLGSGSAGAGMLLNTSLTSTGRLGVAVVFPPQNTFTVGTQEVVRVTFNSLPLLGTTTNTNAVSFADLPIVRELTDQQLQILPAYYSNGVVILSPTGFEGDVSPRPNGNQAVTTADWAQAARFAARLDVPAAGIEFQRADAAPRSSLGDGRIKVTDWVQTGRCLAGLDVLIAAGGPTTEVTPIIATSSLVRQLRLISTNVVQGQSVEVSIVLDAQGDENALGLTLNYDPSVLTYSGATTGGGASGTSLILNSSQTGAGRLGMVVGMPVGSVFGLGTREIVQVTFISSPTASGLYPLTSTDQLVTRCVADLFANELPVGFVSGTLTITSANGNPVLAISKSGTNAQISWPSWAANYLLQSIGETNGLQGEWTNSPVTLQTNGEIISVLWPIDSQPRFFRLYHP